MPENTEHRSVPVIIGELSRKLSAILTESLANGDVSSHQREPLIEIRNLFNELSDAIGPSEQPQANEPITPAIPAEVPEGQ